MQETLVPDDHVTLMTIKCLVLTGELTKNSAQSTPVRPCVEASQPHHKPHPLRTRRVFMLSAKIPSKLAAKNPRHHETLCTCQKLDQPAKGDADDKSAEQASSVRDRRTRTMGMRFLNCVSKALTGIRKRKYQTEIEDRIIASVHHQRKSAKLYSESGCQSGKKTTRCCQRSETCSCLLPGLVHRRQIR